MVSKSWFVKEIPSMAREVGSCKMTWFSLVGFTAREELKRRLGRGDCGVGKGMGRMATC